MTNQAISGDQEKTLLAAYRFFNARQLDEVLACMIPSVVWPNGMEGGYVYGHQGVRDYWTRQWGLINPHVEPLRMELDVQGRIVVEVHQIVRDLAGNILIDTIVHHAYTMGGGLIESMDIE